MVFVLMSSNKCTTLTEACYHMSECSQALLTPTQLCTISPVISGSGLQTPLSTHSDVVGCCRERLTRILMAQAEQLQEVTEAGEGRIAVAVGLKNVRCS